MKLASKTRPPTARERLMTEYVTWDDGGRLTAPTARLLAGMYAFFYRKRYHIAPVSAVQDDVESFDAMLALLDGDMAIAPYCIEVLFGLKEFNVNARAFSNPNVLDKWNVVERANQLRRRNGRGEQAEFGHSTKQPYGVVRV
jgi:hypothetical protein